MVFLVWRTGGTFYTLLRLFCESAGMASPHLSERLDGATRTTRNCAPYPDRCSIQFISVAFPLPVSALFRIASLSNSIWTSVMVAGWTNSLWSRRHSHMDTVLLSPAFFHVHMPAVLQTRTIAITSNSSRELVSAVQAFCLPQAVE